MLKTACRGSMDQIASLTPLMGTGASARVRTISATFGSLCWRYEHVNLRHVAGLKDRPDVADHANDGHGCFARSHSRVNLPAHGGLARPVLARQRFVHNCDGRPACSVVVAKRRGPRGSGFGARRNTGAHDLVARALSRDRRRVVGTSDDRERRARPAGQYRARQGGGLDAWKSSDSCQVPRERIAERATSAHPAHAHDRHGVR